MSKRTRPAAGSSPSQCSNTGRIRPAGSIGPKLLFACSQTTVPSALRSSSSAERTLACFMKLPTAPRPSVLPMWSITTQGTPHASIPLKIVFQAFWSLKAAPALPMVRLSKRTSSAPQAFAFLATSARPSSVARETGRAR